MLVSAKDGAVREGVPLNLIEPIVIVNFFWLHITVELLSLLLLFVHLHVSFLLQRNDSSYVCL
jgi:hypothetical protein